MYNESNTLRGLDNLFSDDTIIIFFVVMVFLIIVNSVQRKIRRQIGHPLVNSFISALLSIIVLFFVYGAIKLSIHIVNMYRFGSNDSVPFAVVFAPAVFILVWSMVYSLYDWFKRILKMKIVKALNRSILESLFLFFINMIVMISLQFVLNAGNINEAPEVTTTIAIFLPAFVASSLGVFVYSYWSYLNSLETQQKEMQIARLEQQVAQTQLDVLSSKINPHFLYNALNSIAGLATENGLKTREMAIALSKLFRYNINKRDTSLATVSEEMEMVSHYLEIEKIRFEDRLQYTSQIQSGIDEELLPINLIQPLVENAIKHGATAEGVVVNVTITKIDEEIIVSVQDKGKPFDTTFDPGYGLKSLYDKLDILAPNHYEISFLNNPKEVRIKIKDLKI